jgi:hypothetical protein
VHGIRGNVSILPIENDLDHDEIVDVLQIIPDSLLGMFWTAVSDDQVSRSTNANLVCNMRRQNELAIVPSNVNLEDVSRMYTYRKQRDSVLSFRECINHDA